MFTDCKAELVEEKILLENVTSLLDSLPGRVEGNALGLTFDAEACTTKFSGGAV